MNTLIEQEQEKTGLQYWQQSAVLLLAIAVIISRRPDAIFHAQFYAEDGHVWYADAYNYGWWPSFLRAHTGYFQTLPRLGASLALLLPLSLAPLVLNIIAIAVRAIPVNLLLSSGSAPWGSLRFRFLLAGMYLVVPNQAEMSCGITESQWLLALSAFLVLVTTAPRTGPGKLFDVVLLLLCGLTGPFCIVLLPFAFLLARKQSDRWHWERVGVLLVLCLIQVWALLVVDPAGRKETALGATPGLFARILGGQVYLGTLLGGNGLAARSGHSLFTLLVCAAIGGSVLVAICFVRARLQMKLFLLLATIFFVLALISPTGAVADGMSAWENLAGGPGIRYWFFPTLGFAWSIVWCTQSRSGALKTVSAVLLCTMCFGIIRDWRHPAFRDMHFADDARRFETATAGTAVTIPENPEGWNLTLVKRSPK
jgi:hypothetical protein